MKVLVVTISDRCSSGETEDKSGPYITERLRQWQDGVEIEKCCVADEGSEIRRVVEEGYSQHDLILMTGGTGLSPRDVTVETVSLLLDKHAMGITTALVSTCIRHTPFAMLSNPLAGIKGKCFIVCMPGSKKAVSEYLDILLPVLEHVVDLIRDNKESVSSVHAGLSEAVANGGCHDTTQNAESPDVTTLDGTEIFNGTTFSMLSINTLDVTTVDDTTLDVTTALDVTTVDDATLDATTQDAAILAGATTLDATTLDVTTVDDTTLDATTQDAAILAGATTLDVTTVDDTTLDATTQDAAILAGATTLDATTQDVTTVDDTTLDDIALDNNLPFLDTTMLPRKPKTSGHLCLHRTGANEPRRGVAYRDRHSKWPMLKVKDALSIINRHSKDKGKPILLPLLSPSYSSSPAHHHVITSDILTREEVPNYRASVKDGYAVVSSDGPGVYRVAAVSGMGEGDMVKMDSGTVVRVTTGAPVPLGADAVVQVEDTELISASKEGEEAQIRILSNVSPGTDIRPVGSDMGLGEVLLEKGSVLNAAEIGLLVSQGITEVKVHTKPTIALLSTGDELVGRDAQQLAYGQVRDCNSYTLSHLLQEDGYTITHAAHTCDTIEATVAGLREALKYADIIITTGGVSMGETDHLKDAIPQLGGTIHFGRVYMKPGKPTTFASLPDNHLYYGLPGNPVSAMVTYKVFVLPALRAWEGRDPLPAVIPVVLPETRCLDQRPEFVRAVYKAHGKVTITGGQCSSRLISMRSANLLLQLPPRAPHRNKAEKGVYISAMVIGTL